MDLPEVPEKFRPISSFIKVANEYKTRDFVIYYWTLFYAAQQAMSLDKTSPDTLKYLTSLLTLLETVKKEHAGDESLSQDLVAQSHIESQALRLFNYADTQDRQSVFNKNVVKAFYTSGHLFDVITIFGPLEENMQAARKYAKWKATYIHTCLKNGETPQPGPPSENNEDDELMRGLTKLDVSAPQPPPRSAPQQPQYPQQPQHPQQPQQYQPSDPNQQFGQPGVNSGWNPAAGGQYNPHEQDPRFAQQHQQYGYNNFNNPEQFSSYSNPGHVPAQEPTPIAAPVVVPGKVSLNDYIEARKFTKMAASALDYEDAKTAIDFLTKALNVLQKS